MAFLDDLSRKITQTGQSAMQKTKEMTDVAKLNSAITEEERKINSSYIQIGRLYAEKHADDHEEIFDNMISSVKESELKIHIFKQQIQDIKGLVRCKNCGAEIPNNVAFCSSCGAPVPKPEAVVTENNLVKCIGCGQMVSKEMKFCTICGKAVSDSIQQQPMIQQPNETVRENMFQRLCPICGAEVEKEAHFCLNCGNQL